MGTIMSSNTCISQEDLQFLTAHTKYDERTISSWYQEFQHECPDGKLTLEGFKNYYRNFFPSGNACEFCRHVFRAFDADSNGVIDFKEFLLAIYITAAGSLEQKLNCAFRYYGDCKGRLQNSKPAKSWETIVTSPDPSPPS